MQSAKTYFEAASRRRKFLNGQLELLSAADAAYQQDADRAAVLSARAWRELGGYLLPEVDDGVIRGLETTLRYPSLVPIRDDFRQRTAAAVARREELASLEEVVHTDILVSKVDDELREITPAADGFRADLAAWSESRWYQELELRGYFGQHEAGLWARFRNWRAVSFLMSEVADKQGLEFATGSELQEHVMTLQSDSRALFDHEERLKKRRQAITDLDAEHTKLTTAESDLHREMYVALSEAIRDHLESTPVELRFDLAKGDPHLVTFFKKISGLDAKKSYLEELRVTRIQRHMSDLEQQRYKLDLKVSKREHKSRRGRFFGVPQSEIDSLNNHKADKWQRRHQKLEKIRNRLDRFDDYDKGTIGDQVLWWDVITRNAPGDDLYSVRTFHEQHGGGLAANHPHAELEAALFGDDSMSDAAAAALASDMAVMRDSDDVADDWGLDAS